MLDQGNNPEQNLRDLLDMLALVKQYPFIPDLMKHYDQKEVRTGVLLLTLSKDMKVIDLIKRVYDEEVAGRRTQSNIDVGEARSIGPDFTDLYTYGNAPCSVYLVNGRTLMHLPLDMDTIRLSNSQGLDGPHSFKALFGKYLSNTLEMDQPIKTVEVMPGETWKKDEARQLTELFPHMYPQTHTKVYEPGSHVVWVGKSPLHKGAIKSVIYERNSKSFIRNI